MNENTNSIQKEPEEDRSLRGTWSWFALNIILFPAPAYMTLLRVKEFTLTRSLLHIGTTFLLFLVLIGSATLQIIIPSGGKLWMLLPIASGLIVLLVSLRLVPEFKTCSFANVVKQHWHTLLILSGFLVVIHILPSLNLIAVNEVNENVFKSRFALLPLWQETIIILVGTLLLLVGYITNSSSSFSVNRVIIIYACFSIILSQLYWLLEFLFAWLSLTGGFTSMLILVLLAAILALDYYDAASFGQYARRYFLLTWIKALCFIILWLSFFGLPQKVASLYASHTYKQLESSTLQKPFLRNLILTDQDRFKSAHEAHRRVRLLLGQELLKEQKGGLDEVSRLINEIEDQALPADSDICRLQSQLEEEQINSTTLSLENLPLFRPVQNEWDVMLSALLLQGDINVSDLDQHIAGFKNHLPEASQGQLPELNTPYDAHYVALATEMMVDFVPPIFELVETISARDLVPVLSLRLAGKDYWSALVHIDRNNNIAWFRLESVRSVEKPIRLLFDANESAARKTDILSHQYIPLPLNYFVEMLPHSNKPVIVFSKEGLAATIPDHFTASDLKEIEKAVSGRQRTAMLKTSTDSLENPYTAYSDYVLSLEYLTELLLPAELAADTFLDPASPMVLPQGKKRLRRFAEVLARIEELRDTDRMDLAYQLVDKDHALSYPELFFEMVKVPPASSDLIDCRDALIIGRCLFLLGHYNEALGYLKIASLRHPFYAENELWYHIALTKTQNKPPSSRALPWREPSLHLYYQTITDIDNGKKEVALKRLEQALTRDSHNSLVNHLMTKYFQRPLNENHFFPVQEGL